MFLVGLVTVIVILFSFQSLFTRLYSASYAGSDKGRATAVFSVTYGVFIAAASFFLGGMSFLPSWQTLLLGLVNAGMLILYNTSIIEAGNRGSYSFLMVASMFGSILVPMAVGVLFLGETLSGLQIVAVLLMLASLVLMNLRTISLKGASKAYYIWCLVLFLSNGSFNAVNNLQTQVMNGDQRTEMLTILYLGSALAVIISECARGQGSKLLEGFKMGKKAGIFLLITCLSAAAGANLLLYALTLMESSIFFTIESGAVLVLSILYSLVLFKEKPRWEQVLGMLVAVASIVLINIPA